MSDVKIILRTTSRWDNGGFDSDGHVATEKDAEAIRQIRRAIHARPDLREALIQCAMGRNGGGMEVRFVADTVEVKEKQ